jgi:hypothetical protein
MQNYLQEVEFLNNEKILVINNYHGLLPSNKNKKYKVVIYCLIGEYIDSDDLISLLTSRYPNSYILIISPHLSLNKIKDKKFNGSFIHHWSGYASYYSKQMPKISLDLSHQLEKYFLSLNNRASRSRHSLFHFIIKFNLIDKFYYSYLFEDREKIGQEKLFEKMQSIIGNGWFCLKEEWEDKKKLIPVKLDNFDQNDWSYGNLEWYQKSFMSIVTESYGTFLTEKSMKPLAYGHPFIIIKSQGALSSLHQQGFKTFNNFINESYDSNPDNIEVCLKEILRISKLSIEYLNDKKKDFKNIIEFNYNHFWNDLPNQDKFFIETILKPKIYKILNDNGIN